MLLKQFFTPRRTALLMASALSLSAAHLVVMKFYQKTTDSKLNQTTDKTSKYIVSTPQHRGRYNDTVIPADRAKKEILSAKNGAGDVARTAFSVNQISDLIRQSDYQMNRYLLQHLPVREGNIPHLYFDSKGLLTTGIGLNVNDWASFNKLDFKDKKGRLLTQGQKRAYYAQIQNFRRQMVLSGRKFNKTTAAYYARKFVYLPTTESRNRLFYARLNDSVSSVKKMLGLQDFYNLHPRAQGELIMMHYNMGSGKFNQNKWPKLFAAARRVDYITMSNHCHIKGDDRRSDASKNGFLSVLNEKKFRLGDLYAQKQAYYVRQIAQR